MEGIRIGPPGLPGSGLRGSVDRERRCRLAARLSLRGRQLRNAQDRHAALMALNGALAFERDPRLLLDRVCGGVRGLFDCRYAAVGVASCADPVLVDVRTSGMDAARAQRFEAPRLDVGMTKRATADRHSRRFYNPSGDPLSVGLSSDFPPVRCGVVAPIVSPGRAYGWILLVDTLSQDAFADEDERLLLVLAGQLGRVYENAGLDRRMTTTSEQLEREIGQHRRATGQLRDSELRYEALASRLDDDG
jgi:GAF domain-containing protein